MSTIIEYNKKIENTVQDKDGIITSEERDSFLQQAVNEYSKLKPREIIHDITGDGSAYQWTLPSTFIDGFSAINGVEYPSGEQIPTYIENEDWAIYKPDSATSKFRLLTYTPSASESIRVSFNSLHIINASSATVAAIDFDAVCDLAASKICSALARYYAKTSDSTLQADSVDYRNKSDIYASRAKELEKSYRSHVGIDGDTEIQGASIITEWDTEYQWGTDLLGHPKRYR